MGCAPAKAARIGAVSCGPADSAKKLSHGAAAVEGVLSQASERSGASAGCQMDPKLGLSDRELYKLKTSWKAVHRHVADTGVEMFVSLFKTNSELKAMFMQFGNIQLTDNVRDNGDLAMHGQLVMGVLDEAIQSIENMEPTKARLRRVAGTHTKFLGFFGKLFWAMEQPFLSAVRITLEDRYNDAIADIYERTIRYVLGEMEAGFNEAVEDSRGREQAHTHEPDN